MEWSLRMQRVEGEHVDWRTMGWGSLRSCLAQRRYWEGREFTWGRWYLVPSWFRPRVDIRCCTKDPSHRGPHDIWHRKWWRRAWQPGFGSA